MKWHLLDRSPPSPLVPKHLGVKPEDATHFIGYSRPCCCCAYTDTISEYPLFYYSKILIKEMGFYDKNCATFI